MLVLSRKSGQKILVGMGVAITVLEVHGNRVRLGIEAPAHVAVLRSELVSQDATVAVQVSKQPLGACLRPADETAVVEGR